MNARRQPDYPPLVVQQDGRLLLDVRARAAASIADGLWRFAELEKCPGAIHVYRLTRRSLWDAAAAGITPERIAAFLQRASRAPLPVGLARRVAAILAQYGALVLARDADGLWLRADEPQRLDEALARLDPASPATVLAGRGLPVAEGERGWLKYRLARLGYPVRDDAGYAGGEALALRWRPEVTLRRYQQEAIAAFSGGADRGAGSGLVLLPCGAGKTLVGVGATVALGCRTLVLCPSRMSARQWRDAYVAFTDLPASAVGEYEARRRAVYPVTVTTYQLLTARRGGSAPLPHLGLMMNHDWGLIVYDEAHLLPADVFRLTAEVQSKRRLGLTATPVREDGREEELFALLGPVLYRAPWRRLEAEGWIAPARCVEVRVPISWRGNEETAALSHRAAATAASKLTVVRALLRRHGGEQCLVLGHYLDQLRELAARLRVPLLTGATPPDERARLLDRFRTGEERVLILSRVGNAALDLPNAAVAIEVSGNFGSRQEEAQRLGRILRPKGGRPAHFYLLVTTGTAEGDHAARRQRFLVEQGYHYTIVEARDLLRSATSPR